MKNKILDILNLLSESIVLFVAPAAILSTVGHFIDIPFFPHCIKLLNMLVCVWFVHRANEYFNGTKIGSAASVVVTLYSSRSVAFIDGEIVLRLGDLITIVGVGLITIYFVKKVGQVFGAYALLLSLPVTLVACIPIGEVIYFASGKLTGVVVLGLEYLFSLTPFLMGGLTAVCFGCVIVSPFSSVAVATILSISGVPAGSATIGIIVVALGLGIASVRTNGFVKSIAVVVGTPKLLMTNFLSKPKIIAPFVGVMFLFGAVFAYFGVQSTMLGAGFGSVGLVGWLDLFMLQAEMGFGEKWLWFVFLPVITCWLAFTFAKKIHIVSSEDYRMKIEI